MATSARNLRITIEYDGTSFAGWQRQTGQRTVQGCLEDAFLALTLRPTIVRGAGRTDAGVHASGQVANVQTDSQITCAAFLRGLNAKLPFDISVTEVVDVALDFTARFSAHGKLYRYQIWNHFIRSPLHVRTTWHIRRVLDVSAMREAAAVLVGKHDYAAFRAADCERRTTIRILSKIDVSRNGPLVTIEVEGTAFLKNMVRILAGTFKGVGHGELTVPDVAALLVSGDRTRAGMTAPAHGLTLIRVMY